MRTRDRLVKSCAFWCPLCVVHVRITSRAGLGENTKHTTYQISNIEVYLHAARTRLTIPVAKCVSCCCCLRCCSCGGRCQIASPSFLSVSYLEQVLRREREDAIFTPLPHHYLEIASLLLNTASDDLGERKPNALTFFDSATTVVLYLQYSRRRNLKRWGMKPKSLVKEAATTDHRACSCTR